MMIRLVFACLWAFACIFVAAGTALAQDEDPEKVLFCGELPEVTCATMAETTEAMATLTSASTKNATEIYLTGGPLGDTKLSVEISSARTFVVEPETLARMVELKAMPPEELAADPEALAEAMLLPLSVDMDQTSTIALSPELQVLLAAQFGIPLPAEVSFHSRVVDNIVYVRVADYAGLGVQPEWMPEWIGLELMAFMPNAIESTIESGEVNVEETQNALMPPGAGLSEAIVYHVPPEQVAWYDDFMAYTPMRGVEIDGQDTAVYRITWDIPRYLSGPLFAEQMQLPSAGEMPNTTSRILGMLSTVFLDGLQAQATQAVGVSEPYLYALEMQVAWALGMAGGPPLAERPTVGVTINTINQDLNAVEAIPAPEGALVPPLGLIMQTIQLFQE